MEPSNVKLLLILACTFYIAKLASGDYYRGATVIDNDDEIKPRTYNGKYLENADEAWVLEADDGVWGLVFFRFEVEPSERCRYDFLEIREPVNGTEITHPTRYCGRRLPLPYISQSSVVHVRFRSDKMWEDSGFLIHAVHAVDKDLLQEKLKYATSRTSRLASPNADDEPIATEESPVFFVLIGMCSAGLVIFTVLLLYILFGMTRRAKKKARVRKPELLYVNQSAGNGTGTGNTLELTSSAGGRSPQSSDGTVHILVNSGRKFSRETSASKQQKVKVHENTVPKSACAQQERAHHNNPYVLRGSGEPV